MVKVVRQRFDFGRALTNPDLNEERFRLLIFKFNCSKGESKSALTYLSIICKVNICTSFFSNSFRNFSEIRLKFEA